MRTDELEEIEIRVAKFLRYGVIAVLVILLIGWIWQLYQGLDSFASFREYHPRPLTQEWGWLQGRSNGGADVIYLGLLVLILLPFTRVLMTFYLFIRQRDYALAAAAGIVLVILLLSFGLGFEI